MIMVGLMCLISFLFKAKDLKHCAAFLTYAGKYLSQNLVLTLLVFIYYILMFALFALMIFQILSYWSNG